MEKKKGLDILEFGKSSLWVAITILQVIFYLFILVAGVSAIILLIKLYPLTFMKYLYPIVQLAFSIFDVFKWFIFIVLIILIVWSLILLSRFLDKHRRKRKARWEEDRKKFKEELVSEIVSKLKEKKR